MAVAFTFTEDQARGVRRAVLDYNDGILTMGDLVTVIERTADNPGYVFSDPDAQIAALCEGGDEGLADTLAGDANEKVVGEA